MNEEAAPFHYVSTFAEAKKLVEDHDNFWVINCGCREGTGKCEQSKHEVCLWFRQYDERGRKIEKHEALELISYGEEKKLVARPFRNGKDKSIVDGVCLCCYDCCYFFTKGDEDSDKGELIESTDWDVCTECGVCVDVCYFRARSHSKEEGFAVDRGLCFGCGLCVYVCPEKCIKMV